MAMSIALILTYYEEFGLEGECKATDISELWTIHKGPLISFRVVYIRVEKAITIIGIASNHIQKAVHFS